jgi:hypothetical protein
MRRRHSPPTTTTAGLCCLAKREGRPRNQLPQQRRGQALQDAGAIAAQASNANFAKKTEPVSGEKLSYVLARSLHAVALKLNQQQTLKSYPFCGPCKAIQ